MAKTIKGGNTMEQTTILCMDEMTPDEFNQFLEKGFNDLQNGNLLDFDTVVRSLETRFESIE